jgi:signal transduction histidine kinase
MSLLSMLFLSVRRVILLAVAGNAAAVPIAQGRAHAESVDLETLLSGISDCYLEVDRACMVRSMNRAARDWFGIEEYDDIHVKLWSLTPYGTRASALVRQVLESRVAVQTELASGMVPGRWLNFRVYPSASGVSVFFRDVSERRHALDRAVESKHLLQSSLNAMPAPLAILDHRGEIAFKNAAWEGLASQSALFQAGAPGAEADDANAGLLGTLERLRASKSRQANTLVTENGQNLCVRAASFGFGKGRRTVVVVEDVTEITFARNAVQELSESLLTLQEAERRRIAAELHDSTAQHLVAVSLDLMRLEQLGETAQTRPLIAEMQGLIDKALREIRSLSYLLYPPNLDSGGLESSLRSFVEGFSRRSDLDITLEFDDGWTALSREAQRALMHVVQEALLNAHRHARASHVSIRARERNGWLRVHVLDDGVGIEPDVDSPFRAGIGIKGMRWRLMRVGGKLKILTSRRGTAIIATFPLAAQGGCEADGGAAPKPGQEALPLDRSPCSKPGTTPESEGSIAELRTTLDALKGALGTAVSLVKANGVPDLARRGGSRRREGKGAANIDHVA